MDGLLEKFVPGGHRGVQLIAYSWELADRNLQVRDGSVFLNHHLTSQAFMTPLIDKGSSTRS
jgi:hypothetical protein